MAYSVKDSLPAYGRRVLVYSKKDKLQWRFGHRCSTDHLGEQWNIEGGGLERETVTHWDEEPRKP